MALGDREGGRGQGESWLPELLMFPFSQGTLLRVLQACAVTFASCPLCTLGATSVHVQRGSSSCPRGSAQVSSVCKEGLAVWGGMHPCGSQRDGMMFPAHTSAVTFLCSCWQPHPLPLGPCSHTALVPCRAVHRVCIRGGHPPGAGGPWSTQQTGAGVEGATPPARCGLAEVSALWDR